MVLTKSSCYNSSEWFLFGSKFQVQVKGSSSGCGSQKKNSPVHLDSQVIEWCNCPRLVMSHGCLWAWWCEVSTRSPPAPLPPLPPLPLGSPSYLSTRNPEPQNWTWPLTPDLVCGRVYCEPGERAAFCQMSGKQRGEHGNAKLKQKHIRPEMNLFKAEVRLTLVCVGWWRSASQPDLSSGKPLHTTMEIWDGQLLTHTDKQTNRKEWRKKHTH